MKFSILFALAFASSVASADVINCTFTEPFISTSYNTATEVLTVEDAVMEKKSVVKGVKFQIKYAGTFLLKNAKSGKTIMELKLTNKGSDGMSDAIYPYEAIYAGVLGMGKLHGGCTSELKPMVKDAE